MRIEYEHIENKIIFSRRTLPTDFLHWHDSLEICQPISGNVRFTVNNQVYDCEPGDIITVQSREVHLFEAPNGNYVNISLLPIHVFSSWGTSLSNLPTHISHRQIESIPGLKAKIQKLFDEMHEEATTCSYYHYERLLLSSLSLYCLLARHFQTNTATINKHRHLLQPFLDKISQDCSPAYSLSALAKQLNYTPEYTSAIFRECVGMGFKEYLDNQRVNEAKRLMLTTSLSILEISQKCGYDNIRTFNNRFKSLAHMTPSEFIRHYR